MKRQLHRLYRFLGVLLTVWGTILSPPVFAQLETEPHPLDNALSNILNFKNPTGIRGILRYIDLENTTIWLNWHERSDDRPFFKTQWQPVPGDAMLAVHPINLGQFNELRQFSKGSPIEMVIQLDSEGKRRILSYHDLSHPPQIPM